MANKNKKSDSISTADLKKTRGGALQYGSGEDFQKHYDRLFKKFLKPGGSLEPGIMEKMNRLQAGKYATMKYDDDAQFENLLTKFAKEKAKKRRTPKAGGKAKGGAVRAMKLGGAVRAMKNGGAVMSGRGPKFKGQS